MRPQLVTRITDRDGNTVEENRPEATDAIRAYTAYIMKRMPPFRRGAAFGAMLAAFDTGVGSGSTVMGWLVGHLGFRGAFGIAAGLAVLALPYFLLVERRYGFK